MFIPIGDDQVKGGHRPIIAYGFIVLNVIIYLYEASLGESQLGRFINEYGSVPLETSQGEDLYTLFTSMFLHGGWLHLIGNMLYLWIFADNIEAVVGSTTFLIFYLLGGLAAHAAHLLTNPASIVPTVGASGALSAVMGAYLVMFPRSRIRGYLLVFSVSIPAIFFLAFWFVQQSMNGYASLGQLANQGGVAWWAHIGGFVFGVLGGFYFRSRYHIPRASDGYAARH